MPSDQRPVCDCHGLPMHKWGISSSGKRRWYCAVKNNEKSHSTLYAQTPKGFRTRAMQQLANRRRHALIRKEQRHGKVS